MTPSDRYRAAIQRLRTEGQTLEALVKDLPAHHWRKETPAQGWTIAHQIAHLAWTDAAALASLGDDDALQPYKDAATQNPLGFVDAAAAQGAQKAPADLLVEWRTGRLELADTLEDADQDIRYP